MNRRPFGALKIIQQMSKELTTNSRPRSASPCPAFPQYKIVRPHDPKDCFHSEIHHFILFLHGIVFYFILLFLFFYRSIVDVQYYTGVQHSDL